MKLKEFAISDNNGNKHVKPNISCDPQKYITYDENMNAFLKGKPYKGSQFTHYGFYATSRSKNATFIAHESVYSEYKDGELGIPVSKIPKFINDAQVIKIDKRITEHELFHLIANNQLSYN